MLQPNFFARELKFMLLLASACSLLLMLTRASIGERAELTLRSVDAILQIVGEDTLPVMEMALERLNALFARRTTGRIKLWQGIVRPELWACEATGGGMWAEITLVFVYNTANKQLLGLRVVEQNETAGLGDQIAEESFYGQFSELQAGAGVEMVTAKVMNNQFDAVSGATVSSKAVETIINKAVHTLKKYEDSKN